MSVWQDVLVGVYLAYLFGVTLFGVTGRDAVSGTAKDRHTMTHVLLIASAVFVPFVSFDMEQLTDDDTECVPDEAWALCATFLVSQIAHTATHVLYPRAPHMVGPEVLFQPLLVVWVTSVNRTMPHECWHRGDLGKLVFSFGVEFVSLAVLMTIYMAGTNAAGDDINVQVFTLRSKSNHSFAMASGMAALITVYSAVGQACLLLGAGVVFVVGRVAVSRVEGDVVRAGCGGRGRRGGGGGDAGDEARAHGNGALVSDTPTGAPGVMPV